MLRRAACSCGDVTINNKLLTDSFEMGGGSVGTNDAYTTTGEWDGKNGPRQRQG